MHALTIPSSPAVPLPVPRVAISIRQGVLSDLAFIDSLQKLHGKQVGWMPTKQLEGKIAAGHVLIAESRVGVLAHREGSQIGESVSEYAHPTAVGYVIGQDQYFKRDDVGIIYQLNVAPARQRGLIGATLLKAMFERAAYGCRLFCCWCAQDIAANHFWESMGFVPLAYRAGSREKGRVHIFWQRRIRSGDCVTPWWFPSQTTAGSIREDRLVLPIRPGTHWSDAQPVLLPAMSGVEGPGSGMGGSPMMLEQKERHGRAARATKPVISPKLISAGGLRFADPVPQRACPERSRREPRRKVKNDPMLIAAARELRDRWLEQVNREGFALQAGKYDVSRALEAGESAIVVPARATPLLPAPLAA